MCWSLFHWNIIHVAYDPLNFEMKCFHQNEVVVTNTASSCHLISFFIFLWSEKGGVEVEGRGRSGLLPRGGGGPSTQEGGGGACCPGGYRHHQGMWAKGCWIKNCHQGHFLWFYSLESWFGFLFTRIMIWRWHFVVEYLGHFFLSVPGLPGRMLVRQVEEDGAWVNMKI